MKTPELNKMKKVQKDSQLIGEFLEWLQNEHHVLLPKNEEDLLAQFFEIDLKKVEKEKREILKDLRKK